MYDELNSIKGEQALSNDFLELYDNPIMDIMTIIWDKNDYIHDICEKGKALFNLETADYKEQIIKWTSLLSSDIVQTIQEHFMYSDEALQLHNIHLPSDSEQPPLFEAEIKPFTIGNETYYVGYFKDVSALREFKNDLANKEKLTTSSWLAAGLVHEIKNPLTSLKGFLQLLEAGISQKQEYYQVMIQELDKLEDISNDLLQMAKPDHSEKQQEPLKKLIDDVVFLMSTQTDLRKIDFELHIDDTLYTFCKASEIKQVLINAMKNSAEAMEYEGTIQIEAYEQNDEINILITDHGEDMNADQIKEMKTPFYTTKPSGTGLGLVITNHILQNHNGSFSLKQNADKGMTVTIYLPVIK